MKLYISMLFIFSYSLVLLRPAVPVIRYFVQNEIYQAKCENKDKPVIRCHGQCHLQQEVKTITDEATGSEMPAPVKNNHEEKFISIAHKAFCLLLPHIKTLTLFAAETFVLPRGVKSDVFHPPSLLI